MQGLDGLIAAVELDIYVTIKYTRGQNVIVKRNHHKITTANAPFFFISAVFFS
jgi:hypothetical protein